MRDVNTKTGAIFLGSESNRMNPIESMAWATTITRIADSVRTTGVSLGQAVKQTAHWEHVWTLYVPPDSSPQKSVLPDVDSEVKRQLEAQRQALHKMKSERDKAQHALKRQGDYRQPRDQSQTKKGKGGGKHH